MICPVCNSAKPKSIYRLCGNMKILGSSFPEEGAFISSCAECGLVYMDTSATQENFMSYYQYDAVAPKYYQMFGKDKTEQYYHHILNIIKPWISAESKILDIAGAWGELAGFLSANSFKDVTVIDPNESCITAAKEKGLSAKLCSSLNMTSELKEKYDLILMNHTLEHILDVKKTMKNIQELLRDGGVLFIEVPDAACYADEDSAPFNFFTYEHVLHLTQNDVNNLSGIYGFEIVQMDQYYKKVSRYPSFFALLKKNGQTRLPKYSDAGEVNVRKYIEKSKQIISEYITPLRISKKPLILWGIGASTAILLESFSGCDVIALIDSNPSRQGLIFNIGGKKLQIKAPETVTDGAIVILSIPYHASIQKQIRSMGLRNEIIVLV